MNAIMPFSFLGLLWLVLTVAAAIAGSIARAFSANLNLNSGGGPVTPPIVEHAEGHSNVNEREPEDLDRQGETLELINNEVTAILAAQYDSAARIDTKAAILVGYAGVAASFLATRHSRPVVAALAYVAFGAAAGFGIWAYGVYFFETVPKPRTLFNKYRKRPKVEALAALAATRVKVIERNSGKIDQKVKRWWISLGLLIVGMVLMISAIASAH